SAASAYGSSFNSTEVLANRRGRYICKNIKKRNYFFCNLCPYQNLYNWKLYNHIYEDHEGKPKDGTCSLCGFPYYTTLIYPSTHVCIKDLVLSTHVFCEVCGESFKRESRKELHMETVNISDEIKF